jgi:hypothetical protein
LGNIFAFKLIFAQGVASLNRIAGWDIFGSSHHPAVLIANLAGIRNLFWDQRPVYVFELAPIIIIFVIALFASFKRQVVLAEPRASATICTAFCLFVAVAWLFYTTAARSTNYVAVKLLVGFVFFVYLFFDRGFTISRSRAFRSALAIIGAALLIEEAISTFFVVKGMIRDSGKTRYTNADAKALRSALGADAPVFISGPWNLEIVGSFLLYGGGLVNSSGPYPRGHYRSYDGENYVLTLGSDHGQGPRVGPLENFDLIMRRDGFTLWKRR